MNFVFEKKSMLLDTRFIASYVMCRLGTPLRRRYGTLRHLALQYSACERLPDMSVSHTTHRLSVEIVFTELLPLLWVWCPRWSPCSDCMKVDCSSGWIASLACENLQR